jgi:DNA-binding NarL/FixJ family response regulator
MSADVRVLVVDDQRPFRVAAAAVLARTPGFVLTAEAASGEEAVRVAGESHPDLVLMDVRLPGISGIDAAGLIVAADPRTVVLLCSTYHREDLPFDLDAPGVAGYLHKEELRPPVLRELWEHARSLGP